MNSTIHNTHTHMSTQPKRVLAFPSISFAFLALFLFSFGSAHGFTGILNGDFEGTYSNWIRVSGTSIGYNTGNYVAVGNYSLWIAPSGSSAAKIYQNVDANPGHIYTLDFWAGTHNPSFTQKVTMEFYDQSNKSLGSTFVEVNHNVHSNDQLAAYQLVATAPENTDYVRVEGYANGDYLKLDGVVMSEAAPATFPIEWLDFSVEAAGEDVEIAWATASELNASHFEVQRSIDGISYERLEDITAVGTSQDVNEYGFTDRFVTSLSTNTLYYRLRQIDLDGSFEYSNVIEFDLDGVSQFNIKTYPNPVVDKITIELEWSAQAQEMLVANMQGKVLYKKILNKDIGSASYHLDVENWPSGIYHVSLIGTKEITTHKVVKY